MISFRRGIGRGVDGMEGESGVIIFREEEMGRSIRKEINLRKGEEQLQEVEGASSIKAYGIKELEET